MKFVMHANYYEDFLFKPQRMINDSLWQNWSNANSQQANLNLCWALTNAKHKVINSVFNNQQLKSYLKIICTWVNNAQKNMGYNARTANTHQLTHADRGLSGSGPWSRRLLCNDFRYGLSHSFLPRITRVIQTKTQRMSHE